MAIYNGRSVQIISVAPVDEPKVTVAHKDGSTSVVSPANLLFTKVELDRIQKDMTTRYAQDPKNPNPNYRLIEDKDHQELLDGQDSNKMEEKLKKHPYHPEVTIPSQTIKMEPQTARGTSNTEVNLPVKDKNDKFNPSTR